MNIRERDDLLLNPLNNIILLTHGTKEFEQVEKNVRRIVDILEKERIITRRRHGAASKREKPFDSHIHNDRHE